MKVYVEREEKEYQEMFLERGWSIADLPHNADLICFTGGSDVSPSLYGEVNQGLSSTYPERDLQCVYLYNVATLEGIPCVGICRGGQFLNVMNGGMMNQHIEGHTVGRHDLILPDGRLIEVTSTHHQAIVPNLEEAELVVYAPDGQVAEVVVYEEGDMCFQPHPEYIGAKETRDYFFELLEEYIFDD